MCTVIDGGFAIGHRAERRTEELQMTKTYRIEVDCANCANKMETAVRKTAGVAGANVNFMTQKLTVDFDEGVDVSMVMNAARKAAKRIDDDFEIYL